MANWRVFALSPRMLDRNPLLPNANSGRITVNPEIQSEPLRQNNQARTFSTPGGGRGPCRLGEPKACPRPWSPLRCSTALQ
jgi:hypothetical protein